MRVLFLTIGQIATLKDKTVHIDVIKALRARGHEVSVLCTAEKRLGKDTERFSEDGVDILRLKIGNITRCSIIEKGINTVLIESQFKRAIKKYFGDREFDLIIYNTPPITFARAIKYAKKKYNAKSYLMLKDIFPQNAVDIGLLTTGGVKGMIYKMFRAKEKSLYKVSDKIGCMSEGNKRYLLDHNDYIDEDKVEIFPNSVFDIAKIEDKDKTLLTKYGIPSDRLTFIYGGNLGRPQGLDFLVQGIKACSDMNVNFVIVGSGEKKEYVFEELKSVDNAYTIDFLPHDEYARLCLSCDVGVIALDHRFTIPNYPSRILSYMENAMPVLATTDKATDIKELVEDEAKCGKWCYSDDVMAFREQVQWLIDNMDKLSAMGMNGREYLMAHFDATRNVARLEAMVENK